VMLPIEFRISNPSTSSPLLSTFIIIWLRPPRLLHHRWTTVEPSDVLPPGAAVCEDA
jgi:hypothetical protein